MSAQELITQVITTLATEDKWCKGANARNAAGVYCGAGSPNAVAFDIYGALQKAAFEAGATTFTDMNEAYNMLRDAIPADYKNRDIESWNDDATFADVKELLTGI